MPTAPHPAEVAFRALTRGFGQLQHTMEGYFAPFGISGAQWSVLRNLYCSEEDGHSAGLRLIDLGRRLLVRPPSVTGIIDRLERAGLVVRLPDARDQRAKRVALTGQGRALVERILVGYSDQITHAMGGLDRGEQLELCRLLDKLADHLAAFSRQASSGPES